MESFFVSCDRSLMLFIAENVEAQGGTCLKAATNSISISLIFFSLFENK